MPHTRRYIVQIGNSVLFVAGLCVCALWLPFAVPLGYPHVPVVALFFAMCGLNAALAFWLLRGEFFAPARRLLRLVWPPLCVAWLIVLVSVLFVSSTAGMVRYGIPVPTEPAVWDDVVDVLPGLCLPHMAVMVLCLCLARFAARRRPLPAAGVVLPGVFCVLCAAASLQGIQYYSTCFGATWLFSEVLRDLFFAHGYLLLLWLGLALVFARRLISAYLAPGRA